MAEVGFYYSWFLRGSIRLTCKENMWSSSLFADSCLTQTMALIQPSCGWFGVIIGGGGAGRACRVNCWSGARLWLWLWKILVSGWGSKAIVSLHHAWRIRTKDQRGDLNIGETGIIFERISEVLVMKSGRCLQIFKMTYAIASRNFACESFNILIKFAISGTMTCMNLIFWSFCNLSQSQKCRASFLPILVSYVIWNKR